MFSFLKKNKRVLFGYTGDMGQAVLWDLAERAYLETGQSINTVYVDSDVFRYSKKAFAGPHKYYPTPFCLLEVRLREGR